MFIAKLQLPVRPILLVQLSTPIDAIYLSLSLGFQVSWHDADPTGDVRKGSRRPKPRAYLNLRMKEREHFRQWRLGYQESWYTLYRRTGDNSFYILSNPVRTKITKYAVKNPPFGKN